MMLEHTPTLPSAEEIAGHYYRAGHSVDLINRLAGTTDADELATIERNVVHLEQMRANPWWDGYDLSAWDAAIALGRGE
jgi:hypothetical protein